MSVRSTSCKKPSKKALDNYRLEQRFIAVCRDCGLCVFHYFLKGEEVPFTDVHHVYGRSRQVGNFRESYVNLLCTCRECHPQPIITPGSCPGLDYVEMVLNLANSMPINKEFIPPEG